MKYLPKTKKFDCVGRGEFTSLFKSSEIDRSQSNRPPIMLHTKFEVSSSPGTCFSKIQI